MKNRYLLIAIFVLLIAPPSARAQWENIIIPSGSSWGCGCIQNPGHFAEIDGALYMSSNNQGMWRSVDDGETWEQVISGGVKDVIGSNDRLFAVEVWTGLYMSTDGGITWENGGTGLPATGAPAYEQFLSLGAHDGSVFLGVGKGLYRSDDDGANWAAVAADIEDYSVMSLASSTEYLFIATNKGLYRSSDKGQTVEALDVPEGAVDMSVVGGAVYVATDGGVHVSTDDGDSWTLHTDGIETSFPRAFGIDERGGYIFTTIIPVGLGTGDLYFANRSDLTFEKGSGDHPGKFRSLLGIAGDHVYANIDAGTGDFWRRPLADFGVSSVARASAQTFTLALEQNRPNPFTTRTRIGFSLSVAGHARLAVYDVLGRQVAVPVDGYLAAGAHAVALEAAHLPAGLYIYRLSSGSEQKTGTMLRMP